MKKIKKQKEIKMKIILGTEYMDNVQGTSTDINIDAKATSDDGQTVILERTLSYSVNTANEGWRETAVLRLKEQAQEFQTDAQNLVNMMNEIRNISADVAADLP